MVRTMSLFKLGLSLDKKEKLKSSVPSSVTLVGSFSLLQETRRNVMSNKVA